MNFTSYLTDKKAEDQVLNNCYTDGHKIGNVCISPGYLFFKKGFKTYYIAYDDATAIYRRHVSVEANLCCEQGAIIQEYLMIRTKGQKEAQIQLPDTRAARMLMEELKALHPDYDFDAPKDLKKQ